jgi:MFS transporter, OFA family, oxalate/formate antiporter
MASRNMVMKWFEKRRGFANAIIGITISFGFSYSPQALDLLIQSYHMAGGMADTWRDIRNRDLFCSPSFFFATIRRSTD